MVYDLLRALSGDRAFCHRRLRYDFANFAPASRR
jgi:hypothetical protein